MRKWGKELNVYWDVELNVPTFERREGRVRLPLFSPRDIRPLWEEERWWVEEAFDREVGKGSFDKLTEGRLVFLNKTPGLDHAYELIVDGDVLARLVYNPLAEKWYVRLNYLGVLRALEKGFIERVEVKDFPKPGEVVGRGYKQVAITLNGKVIGVAIPKAGKLRVDRMWKNRRGALSTRGASLEDVYKANEEYINDLLEFSKKVLSEVKGEAYISFSGGKDSTLAAYLAKEYGIDAKLVFNDTTLEMPETVEYVNKAKDFLGMELLIIRGSHFWEGVNAWGPPARDLRWCCKVCKLAPSAEIFRRRVFNILGTRWWESLERSRDRPIMRMKYFPSVVAVNPILPWPQLLEFLYLMRKGVPLNPLYFKGFDRIGCFMCPGATAWEFKLVKELHPELWAKWEEVLERWRKRLGYGEWWVKGGWRWFKSNNKEVLAKKAGERVDYEREKRERIGGIRAYKRGEEYVIEGFDPFKVRRLLPALGNYKLEGDKLIVKELEKGLKVVLAAERCIACSACVKFCPTGAIRVERYAEIEESKCVSCFNCMNACPAGVLSNLMVSRASPES